MNFSTDELQALRDLRVCSAYESAVHARLVKAGLVARNRSTRFGKTVSLTRAGFEFTNTDKTSASGSPGLAANGGGAGRKRRRSSTQPRAETLAKGRSSPVVTSRAAAPKRSHQ